MTTPDNRIRALFARHAGVVMSVPEFAQLMGMSESSVLNYIKDGRLPAIKLERGYRILTDDAIAFVEERYSGGEPQDDRDAIEHTQRVTRQQSAPPLPPLP